VIGGDALKVPRGSNAKGIRPHLYVESSRIEGEKGISER